MTPKTDSFFEEQSENTAAKINFYQKYIGNYLIKALMQFGVVYIFDLFCGAGKNGDKDGSPLILLKEARKMLSSKVLKDRNETPIIKVYFNDAEKENIDGLSEELEKLDLDKNKIQPVLSNNNFDALFKDIKNTNIHNLQKPKFFFLDPYGYSQINIQAIESIMKFQFSECLIFIPTSHIYRFKDAENRPDKITSFLNTFTDGKYTDEIDSFNNSIKTKLKTIAKYVRFIKLDGGVSKYALFLLTNNIHGMKLMNELVWKNSEDGKGKTYIKKENKQFENNLTLFGNEIKPDNVTSRFEYFYSKIKEKLLEIPTNKELIEYTIALEFLPKHTNEYLKNLQSKDEMEVNYLSDKQKGLYLGFDNYKKEPLCRFKLKE